MKELSLEKMERIGGGGADDCVFAAVGVIGIALLFTNPVTPFLTPVVGTFAGTSTTWAIMNCINGE